MYINKNKGFIVFSIDVHITDIAFILLFIDVHQQTSNGFIVFSIDVRQTTMVLFRFPYSDYKSDGFIMFSMDVNQKALVLLCLP